MAEPKTKVNDASVADFLDALPDARLREDCWTIATIMQAATRAKPKMWGTSIVGFGECRLVYASGKEADWPLTAFSPRKQNLTLYIMDGFREYDALLARLGTHTRGKSCLHLKRLSDIHLPTLKQLVRASVRHRIKADARIRHKRP